jgi:hypothetical protein
MIGSMAGSAAAIFWKLVLRADGYNQAKAHGQARQINGKIHFSSL